MSLSVHAYVRNDASEMVFLENSELGHDLAGFEAFRTTFYGGQTARSLGLRLLPSLADGNVFAEGNELMVLEEEAKVVINNIESFTDETKTDASVLRYRIQNILNAIERAKKVSGGVVIW